MRKFIAKTLMVMGFIIASLPILVLAVFLALYANNEGIQEFFHQMKLGSNPIILTWYLFISIFGLGLFVLGKRMNRL